MGGPRPLAQSLVPYIFLFSLSSKALLGFPYSSLAMASFFQPGLDDPARQDCPDSTFQVYCNSILPSHLLFNNLYQLVGLVLGGVCIVVPITLYLIYQVLQRRTLPAAKGPVKPPVPRYVASLVFPIGQDTYPMTTGQRHQNNNLQVGHQLVMVMLYSLTKGLAAAGLDPGPSRVEGL